MLIVVILTHLFLLHFHVFRSDSDSSESESEKAKLREAAVDASTLLLGDLESR